VLGGRRFAVPASEPHLRSYVDGGQTVKDDLDRDPVRARVIAEKLKPSEFPRSASYVTSPVAGSPTLDEAPTRSPDGTRIAFASTRSGTWELWTIAPDGGTLTQLTTGGPPGVCGPADPRRAGVVSVRVVASSATPEADASDNIATARASVGRPKR
jgi:hypothetical protein